MIPDDRGLSRGNRTGPDPKSGSSMKRQGPDVIARMGWHHGALGHTEDRCTG